MCCRVLWWGPAQLPNMQFVLVLCPLPQGCNIFLDFHLKPLLSLLLEPEHTPPGICLASELATMSVLEVLQAKYSTSMIPLRRAPWFCNN